MESAFIIMGTIAVFAYLSSQTPNMLLRHVMRLMTILLMLAGAAVVYLVDNAANVPQAAEIWAYSVALAVLAVLGTWIISWIIGLIQREGNMKNEEDL